MKDKIKNSITLAPFTTFNIGGPAQSFVEVCTHKEIEDAIARTNELHLPIFPLGGGSNILVPDAGVNGIVLKISLKDISFQDDGDEMLIIADAGVQWEKIVDTANEKNLFGIENLAGIPGTAGGATVQNIGAYGAELANVFEYADVIDSTTGEHKRIGKKEAEFAYRTSFFKKHRELIIIRVALRLSKSGEPNISYPDLKNAVTEGRQPRTPSEISCVVRDIRAKKFPNLTENGTAGSFFKNPVISSTLADSLAKRFPGLPIFPQGDNDVKIPLAWILDHALSLKGFSKGNVRLYEKQPLVIVTSTGATSAEVDAFANEIAGKVFSVTGISIEREVETFGSC